MHYPPFQVYDHVPQCFHIVCYRWLRLRSVQVSAYLDPMSHLSWYFSDDSISAQCQIALTNTLAIPDFTNCSAATLFFTSISASFATNSSIVPSIELWLPSFCNSPQCSNATIAAVIQTIGEGCGSDLDINASIASLTSTIEQVYPTVRQIYCLEE